MNPKGVELSIDNLERETGVEPATSTLARSHSTTELLPLDSSIIAKPNEHGQTSTAPASWLFLADIWIPLRIALGFHQFAVANVKDTIAERSSFGIMRDHQHRLPQF